VLEDPFKVYSRLALSRLHESEPALRAEAAAPHTTPERLVEIAAELARAGRVHAATVLAANSTAPTNLPAS